MKLRFKPSLTYDGGSGFSGSEASRERQERRDATGLTSQTQMALLGLLDDAQEYGVTIAEAREQISGQHHGSLSGALTNMNNDNRVVMLSAKRGRCHIYVLPEYQGEREPAMRRRHVCPNCGFAS